MSCFPCQPSSPKTYASQLINFAQGVSSTNNAISLYPCARYYLIPIITGIGAVILGAAGAVGNGILVVMIVPLCVTGSEPLKRLASCIGMVFKGAGIFISGLAGHNLLIVHFEFPNYNDDALPKYNRRSFQPPMHATAVAAPYAPVGTINPSESGNALPSSSLMPFPMQTTSTLALVTSDVTAAAAATVNPSEGGNGLHSSSLMPFPMHTDRTLFFATSEVTAAAAAASFAAASTTGPIRSRTTATETNSKVVEDDDSLDKFADNEDSPPASPSERRHSYRLPPQPAGHRSTLVTLMDAPVVTPYQAPPVLVRRSVFSPLN